MLHIRRLVLHYVHNFNLETMSELEAVQDRWKEDQDISAGGMKGIEDDKVLGKVRFRCHEQPEEHYEIHFSLSWRPMKDELSVDQCRVCGSSQSGWEGVHVSSSAPKCQDNSIDPTASNV